MGRGTDRKPLALTAGDPAGIGADVALMAWTLRRERELPAFYILGDPDFLASRAGKLGLEVPIAAVSQDGAAARFGEALPVVPLSHAFEDRPGQPDSGNAPGIIEAIDRGVEDTRPGAAPRW